MRSLDPYFEFTYDRYRAFIRKYGLENFVEETRAFVFLITLVVKINPEKFIEYGGVE